MRMSVWCWSLLALVGAISADAAPQSVLLEFKGEEGDRIRYFTRVDVKGQVRTRDGGAAGKPVDLPVACSGHVASIVRIDAVTAKGDLVMGGSIESFAFSTRVGDVSMSLGIEGPGGTPPKTIKLPPLPILTVMRKDGRLIGIKGLEKLPILANIAVSGAEDQKMTAADLLQRLVPELSVPLFPDHPVKPGDTWSRSIDLDIARIIDMLPAPLAEKLKTTLGPFETPPAKSDYRLEGFETVGRVQCAKVKGRSEWAVQLPAGKIEERPIALTGSLRVDRTILFDYTGGRCQSVISDVSLELKRGDERDAGGLTLTIHTDTRRE